MAKQIAIRDEISSHEDEDGYTKPKLGDGPGGAGAGLKIHCGGKVKDFKDGPGICSPDNGPPQDAVKTGG